MQRKMMVFLALFVVVSLLISPANIAQAQTDAPGTTSACPPFDPARASDQGFIHSLPPECVKAYKELVHRTNDSASVRKVQPMAVDGPDGFGYTLDDSVTYNWISASTNSGLIGDDDFTGPVNIGFDFPFYGITQSNLYFSTNGLITFGNGSYEWGGTLVPSQLNPNDFIAPFWDDLVVGDYGNTGSIYYSSGGSAPNRYFVVEWRNVERWFGSSPFSFEAILYENGDIVVQHQSLPSSCYCTVGIEDSIGYQGLEYHLGDLSAPRAIRFYYPAPAARVLVSPPASGQFASVGSHTDFLLTVTNTGDLGADTYDLTTASSWPVTLYQSDGTTELTDTDADTIIDTGPVPQQSSVVIIARFSTPGGAQTGDDNLANITATSSLNLSKTQTVDLSISIPPGFANVFMDEDDGAMSFFTVHPSETNRHKVTGDGYFGYDGAVTRSPDGNYFYAWSKFHDYGNNFVNEIEYVLLDHNGSIVRPKTKLTNHSSAAMQTYDDSPSIAVAPNGTIGVVWSRYLYNWSTGLSNSNIYLATLNASGALLTGPTNITNNAVWDDGNTLNVPYYFDQTIAASSDNRFIISWRDERQVAGFNYTDNIWYAVRNTAGGSVFPPTALTNDGGSRSPVLNSLSGGKVILTWATFFGEGPYYAVINSNGSIFKTKTAIGDGTFNWTADAVLMPNGKVAVASVSYMGIQFAILNSSYNIESGLTTVNNPSDSLWDFISVTTDSANHVIMTWDGGDGKQFYALGDSTGSVVTQPMSYRTSSSYVHTGRNGQGNAPYSSYTFADVPDTHMFWKYIEAFYDTGITTGCSQSPLKFCPLNNVTRGEMAVFLERAMGNFSPTPSQTGMFADVPNPNQPPSFQAFIEEFYLDGITTGCSTNPLKYCPQNYVTRGEMAVFIERALGNFSPTPSQTGIFADVPNPNQPPSFQAFIEQFYLDGITTGCAVNPLRYCPMNNVTRQEMAVFIVRAFGIPLP
jgi:hypothetical protein